MFAWWLIREPWLERALLALDCNVLTDGLRVAKGDSAGVKFGENARFEKLDSWLIGLCGKLTILVSWLVLAELKLVSLPLWLWLSTRGGAPVIIGGGPPTFNDCAPLALNEPDCGIVCTGFLFGCIVSSLSRAISAKTSARGWNCGPQLSK